MSSVRFPLRSENGPDAGGVEGPALPDREQHGLAARQDLGKEVIALLGREIHGRHVLRLPSCRRDALARRS